MTIAITTPYKKIYAGLFAKTAHVFFSSGQSNCQGAASSGGSPLAAGVKVGNIKTWRRNINGGTMYSGTGAWYDLEYGTNQYEGRGQFGSIVKYSLHLRDNLETANDNVYFIKADGNGKAIVGWAPGGNEYNAMVDGHIVPAMASLIADTTIDRIIVHDFFWDQGENDAGSLAEANAYYSALVAFIGNVRALLNTPKLRFVIRRLGSFYPSNANGAIVIQAQEDAAANLENIELLTEEYTYNGDAVHLDAAGQILVGTHRYQLWASSPTGVEYNG